MVDNLTKVPKRGILKMSTSFEHRENDPHHVSKNPHFDESNIQATLHPSDKDYGLMRIEEPKTPFEYASGGEDESGEGGENQSESDGAFGCNSRSDELDANLLAARIAAEEHRGLRSRRFSEPSGDEEDLRLLPPEERERRRKFEQKRKSHYNEFYVVKMARQLMNEAEDGDGEAEESTTNSTVETEASSNRVVNPSGGSVSSSTPSSEAVETSKRPEGEIEVDNAAPTSSSDSMDTSGPQAST